METNKIQIQKEATLVEVLDRILENGVVVKGELLISVAEVELIYVGINLLLTSIKSQNDSQE